MMRRENIQHSKLGWRNIMILACLAVMILTGCQGKEESADVNYFYSSMKRATETTTENEEKDKGDRYLILSMNSADQVMRVYHYADRREYQYYYGMGTDFRDKYGKRVSVAGFEVGDAIHISNENIYGKVTTVQKSDEVWVYDNITRFQTDPEAGILKIGDKNYRVSEETFLFSDEKRIDLSEISESDILSVVGVDKDILSVSITTGHGFLRLKNTKLFEGSFLQLDTNIFAEIVPDMELELAEGKYTLAVANNGWGGSTEVTVQRGDTTYVDLDKLKGEGPKRGKIQFSVDVDGAEIYIGNKKIDASRPVELKYGAHHLSVVAEGYDTWTRILYVNSKEATILIRLKDEEEKVTTEEMTAQQPEDAPVAPTAPSAGNTTNNSSNTNNSNNGNSTNSTNNSNNNSNNNNNNSNNTNNSTSFTDEQLRDYLSTITTLLKGISS